MRLSSIYTFTIIVLCVLFGNAFILKAQNTETLYLSNKTKYVVFTEAYINGKSMGKTMFISPKGNTCLAVRSNGEGESTICQYLQFHDNYIKYLIGDKEIFKIYNRSNKYENKKITQTGTLYFERYNATLYDYTVNKTYNDAKYVICKTVVKEHTSFFITIYFDGQNEFSIGYKETDPTKLSNNERVHP